jgi:hypothetical protein
MKIQNIFKHLKILKLNKDCCNNNDNNNDSKDIILSVLVNNNNSYKENYK